jgi:L-lactate utilization protein LutC
MSLNGRDAFLQRVRQAVNQGQRAGTAPPLPQRGTVGYQGAGADPIHRFCDELTAAGGYPHVAADREAARAWISDFVQKMGFRRVLLGRGKYLDSLELADALRGQGAVVDLVDALPAEASRQTFFAADVGISGVEYVIAETGTLAMATRPEDPRSLSLLPPVHVAVAHRQQLLPDLFDLFSQYGVNAPLPSCLSLITGPSKTGDIELKLVTGVHGPGELHVLVLTS